MRLGVLREAFVVADVASRFHDPAQVRSTFQRRGRTTKPLAPRGRETVLRVMLGKSPDQLMSWPA